jgi:C-terminal processing protease CtpA/Prc
VSIGAARYIFGVLALVSCAASRPLPKSTADHADQLFDAAAAWDEFAKMLRANYAYLERQDFSVEAQLNHSRELALEATNAAAFRKVLHQTTFAFTDPHFIVGPFDDADPNIIPTSSDLVIELQEAAVSSPHEGGTVSRERYLVADVRAESAADVADIRPGWELVSVDGEPVQEAMERIWGSVVLERTARQRAYAATLAANGRRVGTRTLVFSVDGKAQTFELANPRSFAKAVAQRPLVTAQLRGAMGIIRFENSLGDLRTIAAFEEALKTLSAAEALVLDLRNTPSGGNTDVARAVIGHFVSESSPYQIHEIPAVLRQTGVQRRFVEHVLPRPPRYRGRVAVIGGRWTGSMGEGLVIGMHGAARACTFASDMGDLLGALRNFDMEKSRARVDLGVESLFHVDGTPREGFVADVPLKTADRSAGGDDPALAAVEAWLSK